MHFHLLRVVAICRHSYLKRPLKNRQNKSLMTNGSLMKVESIAECSNRSNMQYLWSALSGLENQLVFLSGRLRQVLAPNSNNFQYRPIEFKMTPLIWFGSCLGRSMSLDDAQVTVLVLSCTCYLLPRQWASLTLTMVTLCMLGNFHVLLSSADFF